MSGVIKKAISTLKKIKKIRPSKIKKSKRPMRNIKVKNWSRRNYRRGGKI
jgi:hypothetical protein